MKLTVTTPHLNTTETYELDGAFRKPAESKTAVFIYAYIPGDPIPYRFEFEEGKLTWGMGAQVARNKLRAASPGTFFKGYRNAKCYKLTDAEITALNLPTVFEDPNSKFALNKLSPGLGDFLNVLDIDTP